MKCRRLTGQVLTDWRTVLSGRTRPELNNLAKKLGVKNYSHGNKDDLVELIVSTKTPREIKRIASPSFWTRWHNHIYGAASLISLVLALYVLPPFNHIAPQGGSLANSTGEKPSAVQPTPNPSTTERSPRKSESIPERTRRIVGPLPTGPAHLPVSSSATPLSTGENAPAGRTFVLSSRVFDRATRVPLSRAKVTILDLNEQSLQTTDNGSFVFYVTQKQLGQPLTIWVESEGYVARAIPLTVGGEVPNIFLEPRK